MFLLSQAKGKGGHGESWGRRVAEAETGPELPPSHQLRLAVTQCCASGLAKGPISSAQGWHQGIQGASATLAQAPADPQAL